MNWPSDRLVLVPGGAGYVGAVLVPKLLAAGWRVRVLDWFIYGREALDAVKDHPNLHLIEGDVRNPGSVASALAGCHAVIHLACISNDPSAELNPRLTREVNLDSFRPMVALARIAGVRRFIFASSSSVYGVSDHPDVDERHPLHPLTDYSRYKALCEPALLEMRSADFIPTVIRPATVCGWSPRLRLDLSVNILTNHAVNAGKITVFGGSQLRPNIHIDDITDLYVRLLDEPERKVAGQIFNAGYQNLSILRIAQIVRDVVRGMVPARRDLAIVTTPTNDNRSYHISSRRIERRLGFKPRKTIEDAVRELVQAFQAGRVPNPMEDPRYYNVKLMRSLEPRLVSAA